MKAFKYVFLIILVAGLAVSCSDDWDSHYSQKENVIGNTEIEIIDQPALEYLATNASYSSMYKLFEETGLLKKMESQSQSYTIFVVGNDAMINTRLEADDIKQQYLANSHILTANLSPNSLKDGQRLLMWNSKYVDVTTRNTGDRIEIVLNGTSVVKKIMKVKNGYIYELNSFINIPQSLLEVLEGLGDDYSIFKDMVLSKNVKLFDKNASTPIGVDASGNTIYDSVFVVRNPYFLSKGFDLSSESMSATMLIPSNEQIESAIKVAREKVKSWQIEREDSILENWCFQVAFFKSKYTRADFENTENIDMYSVFGKQWRTTVNKVDLDNPIEMSNGIAYYIKSLKIPQNVLIYRLKGLMKWHQNMTQEDKDKYFVLHNFAHQGYTTVVKAWTPGGGWPAVSNISVDFPWAKEGSFDEGWIDFTGFKFILHNDNTYDIKPYVIPPGEYSLCMGLSAKYMSLDLSVYFNGEFVRKIGKNNLGDYEGDRWGGGAPEFFDLKNSKYDRDGQELGKVVVPDGEPAEIKLRFYAPKMGNFIRLEHWCVRPTENCY